MNADGVVQKIISFFFGSKTPPGNGAPQGTIPNAPGPGGCSPEFVDAQVKGLMSSSIAGGSTGASAGPGAAAGSAAASAAPAILSILSGPCGPNIEKKLKALAASLDPHIGERANKLLREADRQRLNATRLVTTPVAKATKYVTAPVNAAKGIAKKAGVPVPKIPKVKF